MIPVPETLSPTARQHSKSSVRWLLAAMRPRQWTKNLIIFGPPFFGFQLGAHSLIAAAMAFVFFCCASSAFYLINDIRDIEADRRHPTKRVRPLASGSLGAPMAFISAGLLIGFALFGGWWQSAALGTVILAYVLLQAAYNLVLKRVIILDIITISAGFLLRALAGSAATGIVLSSWFLLCTSLLALFLAIEKRKGELTLINNGSFGTREVLEHYSLPLLSRMESIVTPAAFMTYALWSSGPQVAGATTPWMLVTLPFVLYGIFRYQVLSDPRSDGSAHSASHTPGRSERPEEILLADRPMLFTVIAWIATVFIVALLKHNRIIT